MPDSKESKPHNSSHLRLDRNEPPEQSDILELADRLEPEEFLGLLEATGEIAPNTHRVPDAVVDSIVEKAFATVRNQVQQDRTSPKEQPVEFVARLKVIDQPLGTLAIAASVIGDEGPDIGELRMAFEEPLSNLRIFTDGVGRLFVDEGVNLPQIGGRSTNLVPAVEHDGFFYIEGLSWSALHALIRAASASKFADD